MSIRKFAVPGAVLAAALLAAPAPVYASGDEVYLAAGLRGANEVGAEGDADGQSTVVLKISGNQVTYAARWHQIGTPTAGHVHAGARGANGDVRLEFFGNPLPGGVLGVTGTVQADPELVRALLDDPGGFYANLRDAAHAQGAVRGQFHRLTKPADLNGVLHGGDQATLSARTGGDQETQQAQETEEAQQGGGGDQDGQATWWLGPTGSSVAYTAHWSGLGPVTGGRVHKGAAGPVVAELFTGALPQNVTGVAGVTPVASKVVKRIAGSPGRYYASLRTSEFDGGAVRGRLSGEPFTHPRALTAEVLRGEQIYTCAQQPSGGYAFAQLGVAARLRRGIDHSFVTPGSGPPQWLAPDGSAVRGAVVTRTPNGAGNIPELLLDATQAGAGAGLLAHATQILRLNTTGGVAPTGACEPGAQARVSYGADYVFLG
ncbi:CHRD domain-containing protein [Nonomuraea basaltis]|uniref:CHRD domain-containing protein n=1 Tax=Nonomuraea basaltis TaxID=2495887 RepID=UPI00110C6B1F|nr:CHRD domain-containing protein [Nonomuraea basaltis]TMR91614.1 CHRD domain-containing protein [Nonomuraea basaltis]